MDWIAADRGYDEALEADGSARSPYVHVMQRLEALGRDELARREEMQRISLINQGITFTVYGGEEGTERILVLRLYFQIGRKT